VIHTYQF